MSKIPDRPEAIFQEITADYLKIFGSDLLSIILYGSGARGDYLPKKSDINFLILLTEGGMDSISKAAPVVAQWHKRRVSTPLFLTGQLIEKSLDTFPIEFLNIKQFYKVVYGEDGLKNLIVEKKYLRLQCERELKGKLLQLRRQFLETGGRKKEIELLISRSASTFLSIFHAVLFLKGKSEPLHKKEILSAMAQETGLNNALFLDMLQVKEGGKQLASEEAVSYMEQYITEIKKLSTWVDELEVKEV